MKWTLALGVLASTGGMAHQVGLASSPVVETLTSSKPADVVATCVRQSLRGLPTFGTDGTRHWAELQNGFVTAVVRYDFIPSPNEGSTIEYRSTMKVGNGLSTVKACL